MKYCDSHPRVVEWSSEEHIVPYISPIDGKPHRYFVDFVVVVAKDDGTRDTLMIEVKPKAQTKPPTPPPFAPRKNSRFLREVQTWGINSAKWEAAHKYCQQRGWRFVILTEDQLGK